MRTTKGGHRLKSALALASSCLRSPRGLAHSAADNGLRLELPPLLAGETSVTSEGLRKLGALYLFSELEQAGIIPVAEALSASRFSLPLMGAGAARKLEEFARRSHDWYTREQREQLFARLFGTGRGAAAAGSAVNHDFERLLAVLCDHIVRSADDYVFGQRLGPTREAALRQALVGLLVNLAPRQQGAALLAARRVEEQLVNAVAILNDPEMGAALQAHGLWDTLRKFLGPQAPDAGRMLTRGQSGLELLVWIAANLPLVQDARGAQPLLPANSPAFLWAARWLEASGLRTSADKPAAARWIA